MIKHTKGESHPVPKTAARYNSDRQGLFFFLSLFLFQGLFAVFVFTLCLFFSVSLYSFLSVSPNVPGSLLSKDVASGVGAG